MKKQILGCLSLNRESILKPIKPNSLIAATLGKLLTGHVGIKAKHTICREKKNKTRETGNWQS